VNFIIGIQREKKFIMVTSIKTRLVNILRKIFIFRIFSIKHRIYKQKRFSLTKNEIIAQEINKYKQFYKRKPNLEIPKLFSEKIIWQKLFYFDHNLTKLADKLLVKDFVKKKLNDNLFPQTLRVFNSYEEFNFKNLPDVFIIKTNHVTGYIYKGIKKGNKYIFIDVKYSNGPSYSERQIKKIFKYVLKTNIYPQTFEWVYKDITPKIFIEEYLNQEQLKEFKFQMANGKLGFINHVWGRTEGTYDNYYDENLEFMDINWDYPSDKTVKLPPVITKMLDYAKTLSKGIPLARIDFYFIDGRILLGEITFFYSAGYLNFKHPENLDEFIGMKLDISTYL